jgi:hypothetical protein
MPGVYTSRLHRVNPPGPLSIAPEAFLIHLLMQAALAAASSREQIAEVKALRSRHGDDWPFVWLKTHGVDHAPTD